MREDYFQLWIGEDEASEDKPMRISKNNALYKLSKNECSKFYYLDRDEILIDLDFDECAAVGAILHAKTDNEMIVICTTLVLWKDDNDQIASQICHVLAGKKGVFNYSFDQLKAEISQCKEERIRMHTHYKELQEDTRETLDEMLQKYAEGTIEY